MNNIWILAEQHGGAILPVSFELLSRGQELARKSGAKLCAMVFGNHIPDEQFQGLVDRGADRVVAVEAPELGHFLPEPHAACLLEICRRYHPRVVIAGATSTGRTLMPYAAMKLRAGLTADCTALDIEDGTGLLLQTRPAIGGNIMATIKCPNSLPQMATVRPRSTPQAQPVQGRRGELVRLTAEGLDLSSRIVRTGFVPDEEKLNLQDAERVVVVGKGIKKADNLGLVRDFADALGAALGASREVVDRGWLSYPHQVGLSGKTISPKLYVGVGVSGAIQHLAGMQTSETIVAINSDPEAQIFQVADFGIVGNLFEALPRLTAKLREGRKAW